MGGYSPLTSFMGQADYEVLQNEMRLADGTFWPVPVTLPVNRSADVTVGQPLALRDVYGNLLGLLHVEEIYETDQARLTVNVAGPLEVIRTPPHYDFIPLRLTPAEMRERLEGLGWSTVVAFPNLDPTNPAHEDLARRAAKQVGGGLLIQPSVTAAKPGDVGHYTRIRSYRALVESAFEPDEALLALVPKAVTAEGERNALLQAIIHRNFGCSHLIANLHDPVSVQHSSQGQLTDFSEAVGMTFIPLPCGDDQPRGPESPNPGIRPAVAQILADSSPPKHKQGLTIWFTGLSGSGKSTVAHALVESLAEHGRNVAFLDGDEIRTHLSKGLGFSKEDRDTNINRVGYVAGLIAAQGGTTICSVVSPYRATRDKARAASKGNFVEIFCDTPIDVCETRDVKGFYAKARAAVAEGKGMSFTGVDDPYEAPLAAEVTLDTSRQDVGECVQVIIGKLKELGYLKG